MLRSRYEIHQELAAGGSPQEFLDEYSILDPNHAASKATAAYLEQIGHKLLAGEGMDLASRRYRYMLSGEEEPNAFIVSSLDEPIVVVSKGLIKTLEYEDELAGVQRHEYEHHNLNQYDNSKAQEWLCDQASVGSLISAGYNPYGLSSALSKLPDNWERGLLHFLLDDHPNKPLRVRDLESHATIIARKQGIEGQKWTPLSAEIKTIVESAERPPSYIRQMFSEKNYDALPNEEKLSFLCEIYQTEILPLGTPQSTFFQSRVRDFSAAIAALNVDLTDPRQKRVFDDFIDILLIPCTHISMHYLQAIPGAKKTEDPWDPRLIFNPVGRLSDLNMAIENFVNSTEIKDAEKYATEINTISSRYKFTRENVHVQALPPIEFPAIKAIFERFLDKYNPVCSWDAHADWSQQSVPVRHALQRIGLGRDARLPRLSVADEQSIEPIQHIDIRAIEALHALGQIEYPNFERQIRPDDDDVYKSDFLRIETARMATKDRAEAILLQTVDWSELETNFEGFTQRHKRYLIPETTVATSGGHLFADEFMHRMRVLMEPADSPYRQKLAEYFLGKESFYAGAESRNGIATEIDGSSAGKGQLFVLSLPNGIPVSHPFVAFAMNDPYDLFEPPFKEELISRTPFLKTKIPGRYEDHFAVNPESLYGKLPDQSIESIVGFHAHSKHSKYIGHVAAAMAHNYLEANKDAVLSPRDMHGLLRLAEKLEYIVTDETRKLINDQFERNIRHELRPLAAAQEITETYALYNTLRTVQYDDRIRNRYETAIRAAAESIFIPEEQEQLASTLVRERAFSNNKEVIENGDFDPPIYDGRIANHEFREWTNLLLVKAMAVRIGNDDGSDNYFQTIRPQIDDIVYHTRSNFTAREVLPLLADAVNAQPQTAFYMRDKIKMQGLGYGKAITLAGGAIEISLKVVAEDSEMRMAAIEFLSSPLSDESALNFGAIINEKVKEKSPEIVDKYSPDSDSVMIERYSRMHQEFWRAPFEARTWYLDKVLFPLGENDQDKFQAATELIMQKVFPKAVSVTNGTAAGAISGLRRSQYFRRRMIERARKRRHLDDLKRTIKDKGLEPGDLEFEIVRMEQEALKKDIQRSERKQEFRYAAAAAGLWLSRPFVALFSRADKAATIMRQIGECYIGVVQPREQRLLLSAVMGARSQAYEDQKAGRTTSPGKFAGQVLTHQDEMGGKIIQGLDSHQDVPADVKADLGDPKSAYNMPTRSDAIEWCQKYGIVAQTPGEEIAYYGPVVAAGSMGYTMFNRTRDGNEYADTILRPDAITRTEREAGNVLMAAHRLAELNPALAIAPDIAAVAQRDARIETNMSLAQKQGMIAAQVYNGLQTTATVNGTTYSLVHRTAEILAISSNAKRAVIIEGRDFKDLPETTLEEKGYKKATAIQLWGTEIFNIMAGKPTDRDRHERNQKIAGNSVGHFDFGMTALFLPTDEQKKEMARVVLSSFRDHIIFGRDFSRSFDKHIRASKGSQETKNYLSGFRRQMLAMGNIEAWISPEEKKQIFASVLRSDRLDPVIAAELNASRFGRAMIKRLQKMDTSLFHIDDGACTQNIQMPALTDAEIKIVNGEISKVVAYQERAAAGEIATPSSFRQGWDHPPSQIDLDRLLPARLANAISRALSRPGTGLAPG